MDIFNLLFAAVFVNNYVLMQFLGLCPAMGVTTQVETSLGMGVAVTFVVTLASVITLLIDTYLLVPNNLVYLRTIVFILVIAALVQMVEMFLKKFVPSLYSALGIYLPLITTNCMVLGVVLLNVESGYNMVETIVNSIGACIGFLVALVLLAGIRERYELVEVPTAFRNVPLAMIALGLMAIAFSGFQGMAF